MLDMAISNGRSQVEQPVYSGLGSLGADSQSGRESDRSKQQRWPFRIHDEILRQKLGDIHCCISPCLASWDWK